ncbi:DUF2141 domain-containing protein [Maribacter sp. ANRC-HE7]|uniref:DUF2141 domain-containing protein n=1 Tax=Maribacter aquimaris TaxID=2737171 RepID=A0ABR7V5J8_9FLAO|nr:DUF2141 domain-containing protein [Maribacter aquimaris]MBD0778398.1 DUF2141 domain-containing protein [Maribacter aquimaris]
MKKDKISGFLTQLVFLAFIFLTVISFDYPIQKKRNTLIIKVEELRNSRGVVQFTLYNKEGSIPDTKFKAYYKMGKSKINNSSSTKIFTDLPKGRYAINVLHDENENGKIDKGLILPTEGIGFSNYTSIGLSNRPNFSQASFELHSDATVSVKIIYK